MTSLDSAARARIAADLLSISLAEARANHRDLPESDATYFWQSGRGGGSLIVGADGGVLFALSSVPFDAHIAAYNQGRRTDLNAFNNTEDA